MSRSKSLLRNLRALFTDDFLDRWESQDASLDDRARQLGERMDGLEPRLEGRADAYESAVDVRIEERFAAIEQRLDGYQSAIDARIDERFAALEARSDARADAFETTVTRRANEFEAVINARVDSFESSVTGRWDEFESATNQRATDFEHGMTTRANEYEKALDARLENRFAAAEEGLDKRLSDAETKLDKELTGALKKVDQRFEERARATDGRLDDRLARIERHIDTRFKTLEERTDQRLETHERAVDGKLHQRSQDIVDRTDLMLQIFEQRLDKLRRDLGGLRSTASSGTARAQTAGSLQEQSGGEPDSVGNGSGTITAAGPAGQLISFRKLAESGAQALRKVASGPQPLYEQIIAWKKVAHEGLTEFAPNEKETVDYILSFLNDPKEVEYVRQHLRRFVSTLGRIPPAQGPADRLLELGSLAHLAPAIRKYCGYGEVQCADFWEADDKVVQETLHQKGGNDSYTFELRNFNVETDAFPYPDGHFRTVICCELIEHLRRDPMHMLWECNRVLVQDGYLLLTTPNIASARAIEGLLVGCTPYLLSQYNLSEVADQHNREYAPYEVGLALAAAGFSVIELDTEDVWLRSNPAVMDLLRQIQISTDLRGDNIFALARKTSAPIERYPKELYID